MACALGALTLVGAPVAAAETLYVAPDGDDFGTCVVAPCKHINYAVAFAADGDTIRIDPGFYEESVDSTGKTLNFVGAGAGTLEDGSGATVVRRPGRDLGPRLPCLQPAAGRRPAIAAGGGRQRRDHCPVPAGATHPIRGQWWTRNPVRA